MDEGITIEPTDYQYALAAMLGEPDIPYFETVQNNNGFPIVERRGKTVNLFSGLKHMHSQIFDTLDDAHNFVTNGCKAMDEQGFEYTRGFKNEAGEWV